MRRRKSSCPDIEHRRTSLAATSQARNGVKLDLYIEDDELYTNGTSIGGVPSVPSGGASRHRTPSPTNLSHHSSPDRRTSSSANNTTIEELAEEVLCLRLLSTRTRYRFGGLQIHIISPVFNVDKLFNVEFDQESQVSLIKSQQSNLDQSGKSSSLASLDPKLNGAKSATIVISPDQDDDPKGPNGNLSSLSADLTLYEEQTRSPKKPQHVSAHSLTKTPECDLPKRPQQSVPSVVSAASSVENNSVKFENVKVYANLDRTSLISESTDLETKDLKTAKSGKSSRAGMRRHTHYYCYIPSSVSQAAAAREMGVSNDELARDYNGPSTSGGRRMSAHTLRRFMAKKVSDTWHSAVRVKKILSDSLTMFNK